MFRAELRVTAEPIALKHFRKAKGSLFFEDGVLRVPQGPRLCAVELSVLLGTYSQSDVCYGASVCFSDSLTGPAIMTNAESLKTRAS